VGDEWFDKRDGGRLTRSQDLVAKKSMAVYGQGEVRVKTRAGWGTKNDRGILDDLDALAEVDGRWREVRDLVDADDIVGASKRVNQLQKYNGTAAGLNDRRMVTIRRTLNEAKMATTAYQRLRKTINPARFDELINARAGKSYLDDLEQRGILQDRGAAEKFLQGGVLDQIPGFDAREWSKHRAGIRKHLAAAQGGRRGPDLHEPRVDKRAPTASVSRGSTAPTVAWSLPVPACRTFLPR
jgi:hypothetical protein